MLLSRFWYSIIGIALGASLFLLSLAASIHNRAMRRVLGEGLSADSQVVSAVLKDDARTRAAHLIKFAVDGTIAKALNQASQSTGKIDPGHRDTIEKALKKISQDIPPDQAFDAVFAVDRGGRIIGAIGNVSTHGTEEPELGGHPVVADALHGFVRDDTLVWGRLHRIVARPVELEAGGAPAGAVIGARIIDDKFARELSARSGAAIAFYVSGSRTAAAAPEGFPKTSLDQIVTDLDKVTQDPDYLEKGRSGIREIGSDLAVQYTRLPGEAYSLGAGYAVGRVSTPVTSIFGFLDAADDKDKESVSWPLVLGVAFGALALGLIMSFLEHTVPLRKFAREATALATGKVDHLQPSKFRGVYRRIASDLNDGIDKLAAAQGGVSRKAADLGQVLGDLPATPQMAAFAVPDSGPADSAPATTVPISALSTQRNLPTPPSRNLPNPPSRGKPVQSEEDWPGVFEQFVQTKIQCGENVEGFTYERFRETLIRNREALVQQHGAQEVRFAVYVKDGRAALKASPVRS